MTERYVALLRAVNVGGTGKLAMADLKAMCADAGFTGIETYIASGNVVFDSALTAPEVMRVLETRLAAYAGKPVGVLLRTGMEMAAVVAGNPFPDADPKQLAVIFLSQPLPADALDRATGRIDEVARIGGREVYVHYPSGMGRSRFAIPGMAAGTARNLNTVTKLAVMAQRGE